MKVELAKQQYRPVVITLETVEEYSSLTRLLANVANYTVISKETAQKALDMFNTISQGVNDAWKDADWKDE